MNGSEPGGGWKIRDAVASVMEIANWGYDGPFVHFRGRLRMASDQAFRIVREEACSQGLLPFLESDPVGAVFRFTPEKKQASRRFPLVNLLLLLATVITTLSAGAMIKNIPPSALWRHPLLLLRGLPFSFTLLTILGLHEFGHYYLSRRHGIRASLPFFIPAPTLIGTMGAVIVSRSPFPDRKSLLDVGVAGPIASFILSLIAFAAGLRTAAITEMPAGVEVLKFGDSLLTWILTRVYFPSIPPGHDLVVGPVAFAGWVGLLVTALNLFPMSQLDGGHIIFALLRRGHRLITGIFLGLLAVLGVVLWEGWLVWVALILLMGTRHLPPLDNLTPLDSKRKILGWLALFILLLCFVPFPARLLVP